MVRDGGLDSRRSEAPMVGQLAPSPPVVLNEAVEHPTVGQRGTAPTEPGVPPQGSTVEATPRAGPRVGGGGAVAGVVGGAAGHLRVGGPPALAGAASEGGSSGGRKRRQTRSHHCRHKLPRSHRRRAKATAAARTPLSPPPSGRK